ncbi:MAG: glycosyltransferase, partial [Actinocrinis sp.]
FAVTVAAPVRTEARFRFADAGARFRPVPIGASPHPVRDVAAVKALRAALADADAVHAHGIRAGALTGLALMRRTVPYVVTLHNAILATGVKAFLLSGLERLAIARADVVLGASIDLVDRARALGARNAHLAPVPAPTLPEARRERASVRAQLGVAEGEFLVLAIGRLAPQKDFATLLDAAAQWRTDWPANEPSARAPRLAIAGDGPLHAQLQQTIDERRLDATLLGPRDDVADLLGAADVLVLTSVWEARAFALQEAMRAGLPVVATATGGTPDLVGDAAVLVPVHDSHAVAGAVRHLAASPDERVRLTGLGRRRAESWPSVEQSLTQLAELYTQLATKPEHDAL